MAANRFDNLLKAWDEGEAGAQELAELESHLRSDPRCRRELVRSVLLEVHLYRRCPRSGEGRRTFGRRRWLEAAAAILVVSVSTAAFGRLYFRTDEPAAPAVLVEPRPASPAPASLPPEGAAFTLTAAIARALTVSSGVPIKAEFKIEDGEPEYVVEVFRDGKLIEIELDARTGEVEDKDSEDEDRSRLVRALNLTLIEAVDRAVREVPGRAVKAKFELKEGRAVAEIEILGDGGRRKVRLDAHKGDSR